METGSDGKRKDHARNSKKRQADSKNISIPSSTQEVIRGITESKERLTDFDQMMVRKRKKSLQRPVSSDIDRINKNKVRIEVLLETMRRAAEQDRQLNLAGKPATKKISLLKYVMTHLIRKDLQLSLLEHNLMNVLAEWIAPLPNKVLPCLQIRESILKLLAKFPAIEKLYLRQSGIGKAVMYLYKHPEETSANRKRAGELINDWCRTIYNVSTDLKALSREERRRMDLQQTPGHKIVSTGTSSSGNNVRQEHPPWLDEQLVVSRPSNVGWIGRARVPMPSDKAYVVRPKSKIEVDATSTPKSPVNRYEKYLKMLYNQKRKSVLRPSVNLSQGGRDLDL